MKLRRIVNVLVVASLLTGATVYSRNGKPTEKSPSSSDESGEAFLGRWDLTLKAPDTEHPSWLEVRREGGQLKADMVGRWGNARPLPKVELSKDRLTFVSPKEEEASPADMVFEGTLVGKTLSGTVNGPEGKIWHWTGRRAPALKSNGEPKWGKPIPLFNGKDLSGWKMKGSGTTVWKVEGGSLITPGNGPELINDSKFEDFKLPAYTCAAGTKFRWKQILLRNHRAIIRGACTDSWLLCRNCRASRENGRASISR